ncbi:MAG: hypothetical protein V3V56_02930 [bacterium]
MDLYALGLLFLGFLVGALSASTGIGWGIITVPVLFLLPALPARQAGGVAGGILGAHFLRNIPVLTLRRAVGAIVIAAGVRMLTAR